MRPLTAFAAGLLLGALSAPAVSAPALATEPLGRTLDGLLAHARASNPELASRRLESEALRERADAADALPDPRFQLELMDVTNTMGDGKTSLVPGEVGQTRYRVIQPLPFWGKRGLRGELAEAQASSAAAEERQTAIEIEARIKTAFAAHYRAHYQQRIVEDTLELVRGFERLVLTRYGVGLVPQQDALRAQSEITRLRIALLEADQAGETARAELRALLALPADAALAPPGELPIRPAAASASALAARADETSPELARARFAAEAADQSRDLAYRDRYPDFAIGLTNNRPRNGMDSWDLMLEVEIPLQQGRRRSQEREAERQREAAQQRVRSVEASLAGRIGTTRAAYAAELERARLLRTTLLPQAEANLRAARADYETGRINFATLIDAETQILETRLRLLDADVESSKRLAELETLVGTPL